MAYTTVNKSTDYFNTKLYTGTGNEQAVTGMGFQPDLTWIKRRSASSSHKLFDSVRTVNGEATLALSSDNNSAENDVASSDFTSIDSDGFTVKGANPTGANSSTYVGWGWKANGAGSANTSGSINSTVSANTTAGFSIVKYTGNQTSGATVGHGLGVVPKMIIVKNLNDAENWVIYHASLGNTKRVSLNLTEDETTDSTVWNNTTPTSSVFSLGNSDKSNNVNIPYIAYCFAEKTGYSKFGSYTGNASLDGTFIYTGFKPAFVIIKGTNTNDWIMFDNKRNGTYSLSGNPRARYVFANLNNAEDGASNYNHVDFVSNGIKIREDNGTINSSGQEYIYMAFGQSLVGSNNVPCTAR